MFYIIIRLILAAAAAAVAYVMLIYAHDDKKRSGRTRSTQSEATVAVYSAAIFAAIALALNFMPVENLIIGFSAPESAFKYNNSGEILEVDEYNDCALIVAATNDGKITTHVLSKNNGKWKLETVYNRRRDVTTQNYCIIERLYVPNTNNCFVIINHSTEGSVAEVPTNVADNRSTKFEAVSYPNFSTFYYGFVEKMNDDYSVHVDGNKIEFK